MKKRDLESLRQQHKAKFTGGKSASAKKEQRQPQISPDIDKTKEESQQLPTREQKLETKTDWKQGEFVEKRRRNFKWVWSSGAILLVILVLIPIFRYVSSNKGSQERNTYQSSWSSSKESESYSFSETSSRSWEVPEDETSQEATAYVDKKAANFAWTFDDILALQVYSSEQQGSGQDDPTAEEIIERFGKATSGGESNNGSDDTLYLFYSESSGQQTASLLFKKIDGKYRLSTIRGNQLSSSLYSSGSETLTEADFQDLKADEFGQGAHIQDVVSRFGLPQVINKSVDYKDRTIVYLKYKLTNKSYLYLDFALSKTGDYRLTRKYVY